MFNTNTFMSKTSSVKSLCLLFVFSHAILLLMMTYTFPVINSQMGTKAFDLQPLGYSLSEARAMVSHLNEHATARYLFPQLTLLDVLYPCLLALFLSSLLFRLVSITKHKVHTLVLLVPFLAMAFDYLENICIIFMITKTLEVSAYLVLLSSTFTILKGLLTSVAWISILYYALKWLKIKILNRDGKQALLG